MLLVLHARNASMPGCVVKTLSCKPAVEYRCAWVPPIRMGPQAPGPPTRKLPIYRILDFGVSLRVNAGPYSKLTMNRRCWGRHSVKWASFSFYWTAMCLFKFNLTGNNSLVVTYDLSQRRRSASFFYVFLFRALWTHTVMRAISDDLWRRSASVLLRVTDSISVTKLQRCLALVSCYPG